ncbi:MAG: thioredoxin family protein [Ardenticatenaceae bacterium]|nr:thioredoxin family protein [Anaerolineales bacterium]MCB8920768.1 thioredoxin family protein [Ardenticatenaceae bacterium]MCB8989727.1 thioredoxin family protein [Ardenticatenaceae bacterium]MCB9002814.1 thioredoxin family protein [Ardenticatenaceae bacterium]
MKRYVVTVLMILGLLSILAACTTFTESETSVTVTAAVVAESTSTAVLPTNTPEPTASISPTETLAPTATLVPTYTPVPTNSPVTSADPALPDGFTQTTNEAMGISLQYPESWLTEFDELGGVIILADNAEAIESGDFANGTIVLVVATDFPGAGLALMAETLGRALTAENGILPGGEMAGDMQEFQINGQDAVKIMYTGIVPDSGEELTMPLTLVASDERVAFLVTLLPTENLVTSELVYMDIVNSLVLSVPVARKLDTSMYSVSIYDPLRDPAADLADALLQAEKTGKRVLLIVGGDWCIDCRMLDLFIGENQTIAAQVKQAFIVVKVNYSEENLNEDFLSQYPEIEWFPHFFIIENDGSFAEALDTREVMTDGKFDEVKFLDFLANWQSNETGVTSNNDSLYFVDEYDPERNPEADVLAATATAQAENKNILLVVGGDWCIWCHILSEFIDENLEVSAALQKGFIVLKVNYSEENTNSGFLAQYPSISGYPHLFVLDSNGELLHSQETSALESGNSYNREVMLNFLQLWSPQP